DADFHARKLKKGFDKDPSGMFVMVERRDQDKNGVLANARDKAPDAAAGERVIGWLWMDGKENFLTGESYVNFRSFYIAVEYRGSEAARALMGRGMEYCREAGAKSVVGKVHVSNLPMRALYREFGFQATHITMEYKI
ncbi:MAG: GNAT family N-acetyltransferase, partial [Firmicutes bacterium]|nr:GNAT family N-acetyltransferase [Bacillota bacterium]